VFCIIFLDLFWTTTLFLYESHYKDSRNVITIPS
jgi:hypothetical protein